GPNAVLAFAREGYERLKISPGELLETLRYSGFRALATKYWRTGLDEMYRDFRQAAFVDSLRRYMPELTASDVLPGPAGLGAAAVSRDGKVAAVFVPRADQNVLPARSPPSPGAPSSLALAAYPADAGREAFALDEARPRQFGGGTMAG